MSDDSRISHDRGWVLDLDVAVNHYEATLCPRCAETEA